VNTGDPLEQALSAAAAVLSQLHDPGLLIPSRRSEERSSTSQVHSSAPIDLSVLDAQVHVGQLLGADGDARTEISRLMAASSQLDQAEADQARINACRATAAGRIYLARRAGHTPLQCPACQRLSVIPADEPGVFECQNDLCSDVPGTALRRFTRPSALGGRRFARVTLAEVEAFTNVSAKTWEQRLRRAKPRVRPVGKNSNGESLYIWAEFEDWLDKRRTPQLVEKPLET
jgi:hypothetical protein